MRNQQGKIVSLWGHERIEHPLYCALTRVRLHRFWSLPSMLLLYYRVQREARQIPHLKKSAFLLEPPRTLFILSIWEGEEGFLRFGTIADSHPTAVRNSMFRATEIWSTEWRIWAVSNNLNWDSPQDWRYLFKDAPGGTDSDLADADMEGDPSGTGTDRN